MKSPERSVSLSIVHEHEDATVIQSWWITEDDARMVMAGRGAPYAETLLPRNATKDDHLSGKYTVFGDD